MSRLILHIGTHKTGSTTIQNCLHTLREEALREGSIFYPKYENSPYHHGLTSVWMEISKKYQFVENDALFYWNALENSNLKNATVLISTEELSRSSKIDYAQLADLTRKFSIADIVLVLRHQADYFQSVYLEIANSHQRNGGYFSELVNKSLETGMIDELNLDYLSLYERILQGFNQKNIIVLNYDTLYSNNKDFVKNFLMCSRVHLSDKLSNHIVAETQKLNASLDPLSVWLSQAILYPRIPLESEFFAVRKLLESEFGIDCKTTIFTRHELNEIKNIYIDSNEKLECLVKFHNPSFNFPVEKINQNFIFREDITYSIYKYACTLLTGEAKKILDTGERYISKTYGKVELEHMHRYLLAKPLAKNLNVLDIASGEGYGSNILASVANSVIGVDMCSETIDYASKTYIAKNLEFRQGSCSNLPIGDMSIDLVVSFETIEHHEQHHKMMCEIVRVLKPDGLLLISSPDKKTYSEMLGISNSFHVKELYHKQFKSLLKMYFSKVDFYGQRALMSSVITPLSSADNKFRHIANFDKNNFTQTTDEINAFVYSLALASNAKSLPMLGVSIYESDSSHMLNEDSPQNNTDMEIRMYWREKYSAKNEGFSQIQSTSNSYSIDGDIHFLQLIFPGDCGKIEKVRLDISSAIGLFILQDLRLVSADMRVIWKWDKKQSFQNLQETAIFLDDKSLEIGTATVIAFSDDSSFELNINSDIYDQITTGYTFEIIIKSYELMDKLPELLNKISKSVNKQKTNTEENSEFPSPQKNEQMDPLDHQLKMKKKLLYTEAQLETLKEVVLSIIN
jgi:ubiquinone/menaquinone biosynthesis C-methylase UbiE